MIESIAEMQEVREVIDELLAPASHYANACRAERIGSDLDVIQTLPLDLALADFKVSIFLSDGAWRVAIERRLMTSNFLVNGRGETYEAAFCSLHKAARKTLDKMSSRLLAQITAEAAA